MKVEIGLFMFDVEITMKLDIMKWFDFFSSSVSYINVHKFGAESATETMTDIILKCATRKSFIVTHSCYLFLLITDKTRFQCLGWALKVDGSILAY